MSKSRGFFAGSTISKKRGGHLLPQCGACKLHKYCTTPKITEPSGRGARRVLFVFDAPDKFEDSNRAPHTSKGHKRLAQVLRRNGFDLENDGHCVYALACNKKGKAITAAEINYCRPNIEAAIKAVEPDIIVPLGQVATSSVVGRVWKSDIGPMARWAGWRIPCQTSNMWICPIWSPEEIIRQDDSIMDRLFEDMIRAVVDLDGKPYPDGPPQWASDVQIITDPTKAAKWLRKAAKMQTGAVAWDYETNMLKPDGPDAEVVSCSVAWGRTVPERCIAYPWHGEAIEATGELLRSPIPKIASNLKFEDRWSRAVFGHRVRGWAWDTMLAAHVTDNRPSITSVKFQAFTRLGAPPWNDHIEPFLKPKGDDRVNQILRQIDTKDLLTYNGLDSLLEFRVAYDQIEELNYPLPWSI